MLQGGKKNEKRCFVRMGAPPHGAKAMLEPSLDDPNSAKARNTPPLGSTLYPSAWTETTQRNKGKVESGYF